MVEQSAISETQKNAGGGGKTHVTHGDAVVGLPVLWHLAGEEEEERPLLEA
jgi:hypothetical protein